MSARAGATCRHVTVALCPPPPKRLLAGFATPWRISAHTARKRSRAVDAAALRAAAMASRSQDSEALLQALNNAKAHLCELQLLPSCTGEVAEAAELASLELVKAFSLLARADAPQRPAPRRPKPAPAVAAPVHVSPPTSSSPPPSSPPSAPDTPAAAPQLPLDVAVRAATGQLAAAADDFLPPYLVNKMRQQQNGKQQQLALQEFPSLGGGGGVASSAGAAGAWGRGRPPTLVAQQPVRGCAASRLVAPSCLAPVQARLADSLGPPPAAPQPPSEAPRRLGDGFAGAVSAPRDEAEKERLKQVTRCASFSAIETVKGRQVNIMAGLELHKNVLNPKEQQRLLDFIWCALVFAERHFSAPC